MFHLYYGNDLRGLARVLGERLGDADADRLLTPAVVLIPQTGMRRWLEIELAEQRGVVANVDFKLPGEFVADVLRAANPALPERSGFDRDVLRWRLLPLLAEIAAEPLGAPVAHYLGGDGAALKRLQLARELAAAFERYQAYRRPLLAAWENDAEPHDWQAELWRRLVRASAEPSRAQLLGDYLRRYDRAATPPGLPPRVSVFGCLNVSPDVLRLLGVVARHVEVDAYLPTPCREYWGDQRDLRERLRAGESPLAEPDQPLLASLGRVGREFFEQVFSYEEIQPASETLVVREPSRATLLGRIQADVLELRCAHAEPGSVAADDSLRVHRCDSPLREVQVLRDRLLARFERDATLRPRDVAVMMPDVAAYAPAIEAVFGAAPPGDPRRIPYTVADRRAEDEHPVVEVFLGLLSLPASRWGAGEILDLLAVPAVMRRFDLDRDAVAELARWFDAAGIRWGLDASTRRAFGAGDYRAFTWAEGIERLLLGYASGTDAAIADVAPLPAVEGNAAARLGRALAAVRGLERLAAAQREPRPPAEWRTLYQRASAALLAVDPADRDERRALAVVHAALAALAENAEAAGFDAPLDWQSVRAFLGERLAETTAAQRFLGGGVSFGGMVPLRAIPFRVIAVLGLDDEAFPRREPASGVSRLEAELRVARRLGDRSVRDDDRYLFLQLLTAAEDALHLSYVGRDLRSGMPREPSAVLAELADVVARDYGVAVHRDAAHADALVVDQPMQPFARALFDRSRPELYTYAGEWRAAAAAGRGHVRAAFARDALAAAGDDERRVPLEALIAFWRNPARAFLRERLHVSLDAEAERPDDDDPLALDGLGAHALKSRLAALALDGTAPPSELDEAARMRWQLPAGRPGAEAYRDAMLAATALAERARAWRAGKSALPPQSFALELDDGTLVDVALRGAFREGLLTLVPAPMHGRHWLRPWLEYLALAAYAPRAALGFDAAAAAAVFALEHDGVKRHELRGIDADGARAELAALVDGFRAGRARALPFFAKTAWAYVATLGGARDDAERRAWSSARACFAGGDRVRGERDDAWIALAFRDRDPLADAAEEFAGHAARVFGRLDALLRGASA